MRRLGPWPESAFGLALAVGLAGCISFPAPPRMVGYGAPGRLEPDQLEVTVDGNVSFLSAGVHAGLPVHPRVRVETGVSAYPDLGAMAHGGVRYNIRHRGDYNRNTPLFRSVTADLAGGLAAGFGSNVTSTQACDEDGDNCVEVPAPEPFAAGAYIEAGLGWLPAPWVIPFARIRGQVGASEDVPLRSMVGVYGGLDFRIAKRVFVHVSTGMGWLFAATDQVRQLSISVPIRVGDRGARRRDRREP